MPGRGELLAAGGAAITDAVARIPEASSAARSPVGTAPSFTCTTAAGVPTVRVRRRSRRTSIPAPPASMSSIPRRCEHRKARAADLVRLVQVAEMLRAYAAQSTAVVCDDVPAEIGDLYRLFLVLWYSSKPVVTGAFTAAVHPGDDRSAGGGQRRTRGAAREPARGVRRLPRRRRCTGPNSPAKASSIWRAPGVPAEIVSVPLAGATAPVTLAGAVVQHAAECLTGIVIHQLAAPGAPVVWGGAPAIFDMRTGNAPMGAIETAMLDCGAARRSASPSACPRTAICAAARPSAWTPRRGWRAAWPRSPACSRAST